MKSYTFNFSFRSFYIVLRNFLVWRKLFLPSLMVHMGEPLLLLLGIGYGIGSLIDEVQGMPYLDFIASGMLGYGVATSASYEALYSAFTRMHIQKTWESMLHAPLSLDDVILGECLWSTLKSSFAGFCILLVVSFFAFDDSLSPLCLLVFPVSFLLGFCISSIALFINSLAKSYDFFAYYFTIFFTPMVMLSGIFFPIEELPKVLQSLSSYLPLSHGVFLIRSFLLGKWLPYPTLVSCIFLLVTGISFLYLSAIFTRKRLLQ